MRQRPWREYLLPIKGLRGVLREAPLVFFLPVPFFFLIGIHIALLFIPILLWWAIGVIWMGDR